MSTPLPTSQTASPSGSSSGGRPAVALVIGELRPGGAERVVVNLAKALKGLGQRVAVVCIEREGALAGELREAGVEVAVLGSTRGWDAGAVPRLAALLRRLAADVINVHDRSSLPYVALANRLAGRRAIVFSAHGLLMRDEVRSRLRDRLAGRAIDAMTAVSDLAAREYCELLNWPGRAHVVLNGVTPVVRDGELRRQVREELGLGDDVFVFLAVGNVKPEKGFEDLAAAAGELRSRADAPRFAVLVAGGTSDEACYRQVCERIERDGLGDVVRLLGYRNDTQALYSAADAFVLSSRKEGLPMVLLEAMTAGLPVVATRVGGVPGALADGAAGLLVRPASPGELASGMGRLAGDAALRERLAREASERAAAVFGAERMARDYLAVYEQATRVRATGRRRRELGRQRPSVLLLGPLPPITGGMATVVENLRTSRLADDFRMTAVNTGKLTPPRRRLWTGVSAQLGILRQIVSAMRRARPRIAHMHTCALFTFWRDLLHMVVVRMLGAQVVWHVHDGRFDQFVMGQPAILRAILRWGLRRGRAVITLSREALGRYSPVEPKAAWQVVGNGIPMPESVPARGDGAATLLFLGDLNERKGLIDLVDAVALSTERGFGGRVLVAGGDRAPGDREKVESRIVERRCEEVITLLGVIGGAEKDRAFAEADALVLPSWSEGLPMSILEAMSWGLPVIATRVGAIPEVVRDGQEGCLCTARDVESLAAAMVKLSADAGLRHRMGESARHRVEEEYSIGAMVERIAAIYREIVPAPATEAVARAETPQA